MFYHKCLPLNIGVGDCFAITKSRLRCRVALTITETWLVCMRLLFNVPHPFTRTAQRLSIGKAINYRWPLRPPPQKLWSPGYGQLCVHSLGGFVIAGGNGDSVPMDNNGLGHKQDTGPPGGDCA